MATDTDQLTVYWLKGCGNCTRLKGYLTDRGIEFTAVDLLQDPDARDEMERMGIRTMPVLRRGDRWVTGFDLDQVDELVGMKKDPAGRALDPYELAERQAHLLELAAQAAALIPKEHEDDPTPTMEKGGDAFLYFRDGREYIPHGTTKMLAQHILGHGEKFKRFALAADGVHELGFEWTFDGEVAAFGELYEGTPMYQVVDQMRLVASDLRAWCKTAPEGDFGRTIDGHYGPQTLQQLMQTMTCSTAQHTRQLVDVIERLGLETEKPSKVDLEGLLMPSGIWE